MTHGDQMITGAVLSKNNKTPNYIVSTMDSEVSQTDFNSLSERTGWIHLCNVRASTTLDRHQSITFTRCYKLIEPPEKRWWMGQVPMIEFQMVSKDSNPNACMANLRQNKTKNLQKGYNGKWVSWASCEWEWECTSVHAETINSRNRTVWLHSDECRQR